MVNLLVKGLAVAQLVGQGIAITSDCGEDEDQHKGRRSETQPESRSIGMFASIFNMFCGGGTNDMMVGAPNRRPPAMSRNISHVSNSRADSYGQNQADIASSREVGSIGSSDIQNSKPQHHLASEKTALSSDFAAEEKVAKVIVNELFLKIKTMRKYFSSSVY